MIVAESEVLIGFPRDRDPAASRIALELRQGGLRTTVISRFELLAGARGERGEQATRDLLGAIPALPLTIEAADLAATLFRDLARAGTGVPMADCLIAGIVQSAGDILLTRNRRHFERFPALKLGTLDP